MSLLLQLTGQDRYPPPPEGAGRVHRLKDDAGEVPGRLETMLAIHSAVTEGLSTAAE